MIDTIKSNTTQTDLTESRYTTDEMMTVAASRELSDDAVCFVGIGLPSEAANLARATHAPRCVLVYESSRTPSTSASAWS